MKEVPAALEKLNEVPSAPEEDLHTSFLALHVPGEGGGGGVGDGGGDRSDVSVVGDGDVDISAFRAPTCLSLVRLPKLTAKKSKSNWTSVS